MLALGLLLIIGATALTVGAVYDGGDPATVEILGQSLSTTVAGVFFTGAVTMLMFLLGVWLLTASMGRARRKRAERKQAKSRQRDSVARLEEERTALRAENERLAEELAQRRTTTTGAAGAAGAGAAAHGTTTDDTTHGTATHDMPPTHDTASPHDTTAHDSATPGAEEHQSDRVIDHHTDLTSRETTTSGRHREL
jgi:hypothetical protein